MVWDVRLIYYAVVMDQYPRLEQVVTLLNKVARNEPGTPEDWTITATGDAVLIDATTRETASDPDSAYQYGRKLYDQVLESAEATEVLHAAQQVCAVTVTNDEADALTWAGAIRVRLAVSEL